MKSRDTQNSPSTHSGTSSSDAWQSWSTNRATPAVDQNIQDAIGHDLRELFDDVLNEPVPQRFVDLLDDLLEGAKA